MHSVTVSCRYVLLFEVNTFITFEIILKFSKAVAGKSIFFQYFLKIFFQKYEVILKKQIILEMTLDASLVLSQCFTTRLVNTSQTVCDNSYTYFFYKQLESSRSPQSCLYFQGFWGSKFLDGCLVV